ncbi:NPC intracellular cholesterol transporter 2 homolog a-like [Schistocerca gregaria]|uniref:NPC intracellular cholesterol transporter 2 homolog a-like n=1 Tax=Schistocerca gregaria TaxID=7010 RepID=UPI00211E4B5A|nr:NPC intracellular cholesterol transporter 2 homolog a-like [Schistocerca gregaria]
MKTLTCCLLFFLAFCLSSVTADVQFCDSDVGSCVNVTVSGCAASAAECDLKRGTNVGITISFSVSEDTSDVKAIVHGILGGIPIPFHIPNPDACQNCGLTCPLHKGGTYTYFEKLPIKRTYPQVSVEVKWQLEDSNGKVICCALIPSRIK